MRGQSKKLKKAIAAGKVVVYNPTSGQVNLQLFRSATRESFILTIGCGEEVEIAPKHVPAADVRLSSNLNQCTKDHHLIVL